MKERLTRERAIELFRQMWSDMKEELGDCPSFRSRSAYKRNWCISHGYLDVASHCFLCEYYIQNRTFYVSHCAENCIIDWGNNGSCCGRGRVNYIDSNISEILALPERRMT